VIFSDLAHEKVEHGAALARAAGFNATARVACGKTWETICVVADEVDAEPIVIGTGGPYRARPREACRARWTGVVITSASTSARSQ
jgi:nucleotide-binding universal stress UspA family protein